MESILSTAFAAALELLESRASEQGFLDLLEQVYGATGSDDAAFAAAASSLQQLLSSGSELGIQVKSLDGADMNGAMGAYSSTGVDGQPVIYINTSLLSEGADPELLQRVLLEEIGHHFDILLNGSVDTAGDEGELFADLISGDTLTLDQQSAITTQSDAGTVLVDGQTVAVEQAISIGSTTTLTVADNDPNIVDTNTSDKTVSNANSQGITLSGFYAKSGGSSEAVIVYRRPAGTANTNWTLVGTAVNASSTTQTNAAWSITDNPAAGSYDYLISSNNSVNNGAGTAATYTLVVVDNTAPNVGSASFTSVTEGPLDSTPNAVTNQATASVVFTYTGSDLLAGESFQYSTNNSTWTTIAAGSVNTTANTVTISGLTVSGSPTVYLRALDAAGNTTTLASQAITYDATGPNVGSASFTSVTEGPLDSTPNAVTNQATASVVFTYTGSDLLAGESFQYSTDNSTWTTIAAGSVNTTANTVTISGLTVSGSPTVYLRALDAAGNTTTLTSQAITYDGTGPNVGSASFTSVTEGPLDSTPNAVTNQTTASVVFTYTGSDLLAGESFQYSTDNSTWTTIAAGSVNTTANTVTISGLTVSGSPTVYLRALDAAGNTTTLTSQAITYDGTGPNVGSASFTSVTEGPLDSTPNAVTNQTTASVVFTYTGSDLLAGESFQYSTDNSTWTTIAAGSVNTTANTVTISGLTVSGSPTVYLRALDAAGNTTTLTSQAITYDGTGPNVGSASFTSVTEGPLDSTPNAVTNQTTASVVFTYTGSDLLAGESFQYSTDNSTWTTIAAGSVNTTANTVTISGLTVSGSPTVYLRALDAAGNTTTLTSQAITYDGTGPNVGSASFTSVSEGALDTTANAVTNQATASVVFTYTGSDLLAGESFQYSTDNSTWTTIAAGSVNTTANTVTISGLTVSGSPTVYLRALDAAGNTTTLTSQAITYDGTGPNVGSASFTSVTEGPLDSTPNAVTNQTTASVVFTYTGSDLLAGESFQYSTDNSTWTTIAAGSVNTTANTVTISGLTVSGSPTVYLRALDAAGNTTTLTSQAITYDGTGPNVGSASFTSVTEGPLDSTPNAVTNQTTASVVFTYTGSDLLAGESFQYSTDNSTWTTIAAGSVNTTANTVTISGLTVSGSPTVYLRALDAAGNTTTLTSQAITYDGTGPNVGSASFTSVSEGALDTTANAVTNQATASVVFTYTGSDLLAGESFQYSTDNSTWTTIATGSVNTTANTVTISGLNVSGSPTVYLRALDAAGNTTTLASQAITYDGTAPTGSLTLTPPPDNGIPGDGITNNGSFHVSGVEPGNGWQYTTNGNAPTPTWTNGSGTSFNAYGSFSANQVQVRQVDAAGNAGPSTAYGSAITVNDTSSFATPDIAITSVGGIDNFVSTASGDAVVSGTGPADSTLKLYNKYATNQYTYLADVNTDSEGYFSYTLTSDNLSTLGADGSKTFIVATQNYNSPEYGFNLDLTRPTLTINANQAALKTGESTTIQFNFSEDVGTSFSASDVSVESGAISNFTKVDGTHYTATYTPASGTTDGQLGVSVAATAYTDLAGNAPATGSTLNLEVDTQAPTVTGISYDANDGTATVNEAVTFVVSFSENVTVAGGTPTLTLSNGGTATYISGSSSDQLLFRYTPATGQTSSSDIGVSSFNLNGSTITDGAGNSADTSGATNLNPDGTLAINTTAAADTTAPTATAVEILGTGDNKTLNAGDSVIVKVTTSEAVTVDTTSGNPTFVLDVGGVERQASYVSGSGTSTLTFSYQIQSNDQDSSGGVTSTSTALHLNGGSISDSSGNVIASTSSAVAVPAVITNDLVVNGGSTAPSLSFTFAHFYSLYDNGQRNQVQHKAQQLLGSNITITATDGVFTLGEAISVNGTTYYVQGYALSRNGNTLDLVMSSRPYGDGPGQEKATSKTDGQFDNYFVLTGNTYSADPNKQTGTPINNLRFTDSPDLSYLATTTTVVTAAAADPVCFMAGTLISTPAGATPIEQLQPGDLVLTPEGPVAVKFVGRSTHTIAALKHLNKLPVRIVAGALGGHGPCCDTYLTPNHGLALLGCLVEAGTLENGRTITRYQEWAASSTITYLTVELEQHGLIWANGMLAESYYASGSGDGDGFTRQVWDNLADYLELYGEETTMAELPMPRLVFSRQLPAEIRALVGIDSFTLYAAGATANASAAASANDPTAHLSLHLV